MPFHAASAAVVPHPSPASQEGHTAKGTAEGAQQQPAITPNHIQDEALKSAKFRRELLWPFSDKVTACSQKELVSSSESQSQMKFCSQTNAILLIHSEVSKPEAKCTQKASSLTGL